MQRDQSCFTDMCGLREGHWRRMASKVGTVVLGGGRSHGGHWAGSEMVPEAQGIYFRAQAGMTLV